MIQQFTSSQSCIPCLDLQGRLLKSLRSCDWQSGMARITEQKPLFLSMQFPLELLSFFVESESQKVLEHVCEAQERVKFHSSKTVASFIEEAVFSPKGGCSLSWHLPSSRLVTHQVQSRFQGMKLEAASETVMRDLQLLLATHFNKYFVFIKMSFSFSEAKKLMSKLHMEIKNDH